MHSFIVTFSVDIIQINSFEDLISQLRKQVAGEGHLIYRGVKDAQAATLIPSVGRLSKYFNSGIKELVAHEKNLLNLFRHRSYSEMTKIPHNDWIWLALAQHHGLSTRLHVMRKEEKQKEICDCYLDLYSS